MYVKLYVYMYVLKDTFSKALTNPIDKVNFLYYSLPQQSVFYIPLIIFLYL